MRFPSILLTLSILPALCPAQDAASDTSDNAIHAITAIHDDGSRTVTVSDPDKHTSEADTYDGRNKLIEKIIYALDDNNQPATAVVYSPDNRPAYKSVYKRDDYSRVAEEDDYTLNDQLMRRFVYEYGGNGKLLRIRAYDSQGNELQESNAHKDQRQSLPRVH